MRDEQTLYNSAVYFRRRCVFIFINFYIIYPILTKGLYMFLPWLLNSSRGASLLWCGVSSPSTFSGSCSLQRGHHRLPSPRLPKQTERRCSTALCIRLCPPRNRHELLDRRRPRNCNIRSPCRRCRASQLCPVNNVINFALLSTLSIISNRGPSNSPFFSAIVTELDKYMYTWKVFYLPW